jgi:hypothetical protein
MNDIAVVLGGIYIHAPTAEGRRGATVNGGRSGGLIPYYVKAVGSTVPDQR